jgi:hypothetical protein
MKELYSPCLHNKAQINYIFPIFSKESKEKPNPANFKVHENVLKITSGGNRRKHVN